MIVGFDLDGTLDKPALAELALALDRSGHEVHVISGMFPDAPWQNEIHKKAKMERLGLHRISYSGRLHILEAIPVDTNKDLNYVLRDLGLRKGALCEQLGITMFFEDSEIYADMIPKMSRGTTVALIS
jgi:hypothetical protein